MPEESSSSDSLVATIARMRIATFNVNSINARLPNLLRWLQQTTPDME